jgi:hypothetical protein
MVAEDACALVTVIAVTDVDDPVGDVGVVDDIDAPLPPHATKVTRAAAPKLVIAKRHTRFIHASPCVHCHDPRG